MEKQYLYNKIKGTLVAAGMGDAMGAPSEAWSRDEIIKIQRKSKTNSEPNIKDNIPNNRNVKIQIFIKTAAPAEGSPNAGKPAG